MCEDAIYIGMTADEFWHGDLANYIVHLDAYNRKQEKQMEEADSLAWQVGTYVIQALQAQPLMAFGMTAGKDIKKISTKYPEKPRVYAERLKKEQQNKEFIENIKSHKPTAEDIEKYNKLIEQAKANRKEK